MIVVAKHKAISGHFESLFWLQTDWKR